MPYSASLQLPWPPTVNTYWRRVGNMTKISAKGRAFRAAVIEIVKRLRVDKLDGRLAVHIVANPPDRRRRDLDNLPKALLDALQHAGLYDDDGQIDWLLIERGERKPPGCLEVEVREIQPNWLQRAAAVTKRWWGE